MTDRKMTLSTYEYLKLRIKEIEASLRSFGSDAGQDLVSSLHDDSSLVHSISMLKSELIAIGNLDNIIIIDPRTDISDVGVGNLVTIKYSDGDIESFNILAKDDVVYNRGETMAISSDSPLSQAILGKKAGDATFMNIGNAKQEIKIIKIAKGDFK